MSKHFRLVPPRVETSENDVEKACVDLLHLHGFMPVRQHVGKFRTQDDRWVTIGKAGDPDWLAVRPPSFYLEVKRPGRPLSEVQIKRIAELRMAYGFDVLTVDNAEQLLQWLERMRR